MLNKLRTQLILSYLPLILAPMLVVGLVARTAAEQGLTLLIRQDGRQYVQSLMPCLTAYYSATGTWEGMMGLLRGTRQGITLDPPPPPAGTNNVIRNPLLFVFNNGAPQCVTLAGDSNMTPGPQPMPTRPDQRGNPPLGQPGLGGQTLLILSTEGKVVASIADNTIGQQLSTEAVSQSVPIQVDGMVVGLAVAGTGLGSLNDTQQATLNSISGGVLAAVGVAAILAMGFGIWLSWRVTAPVRVLMAGVHRLSSGSWTAPLRILGRGELAELTEAFNRMAGEITRQQSLNRQMVADIAHDLRTPLSIMMLEIEAVEAGFQPPAQAASALRQEVRWLQRLVDDLRLLSLMDAEQITLRAEPTGMDTFLANLGDFWQTTAEAQDRHMQVELPPGLPRLDLDQKAMRQVLGNLLDNAIRHTRPGDLITLRALDLPGELLIEVTDTGEGIPAEDVPHIFDRFYRADRSRRHDKGGERGGTGLGLSIARRYVELHGGTIQVASRYGYGATFAIRLPKQGATLPALPVPRGSV